MKIYTQYYINSFKQKNKTIFTTITCALEKSTWIIGYIAQMGIAQEHLFVKTKQNDIQLKTQIQINGN